MTSTDTGSQPASPAAYRGAPHTVQRARFASVRVFWVVYALTCIACGVARAGAQDITPRIVNGTVTASFPSTGALLIYEDSTQTELSGLCSGTLIGCRTFVTAAHCVCNDQDDAGGCTRAGVTSASMLRVFFQQVGYVDVSAVAISPDFDFGEAGDVAVLQLADPVSGIDPSPINTVGKPIFATPGTIVGFGRTMNVTNVVSDAGIKRQGKVTVADCGGVVPGTVHVCWQFLGANASTCSGDSGGPLFVEVDGTMHLAGVTSGGINSMCAAPDRSFDTDVFVYADFIAGHLDACTGVSASDANLFSLLSTDGELSRSASEMRFDVDVPAGTSSLRFTLNGQLSGADFDLYVRAGSEPTTDTYDCADINTSSFGACSITAPGTETWHILVRRAFGIGTFQLNVNALVVPTPQDRCIGDCDASGAVSVEDLVTGVNVALGRSAAANCSALDGNEDGIVTVDELVAAVANALGGCVD